MSQLSPIEDIIADAKAGRMFILVDDEDRENEGDLIIPAQFASTEAVNFMAKHGRGLICLALASEQVQRLGLPPMARHNESRHKTAFTISIEAREGITTGISAADRARTIQVASDPTALHTDIASPGHIFPLEARPGGVLVRAGHTEAAVDISRLAGLNPAGVICEVMNDDGSMARLPELLAFAAQHGLKVGTIADLIAYRRRSEKLVRRLTQTRITTANAGEFTCYVYAQSPEYAEHIALVKGSIPADKPTLVRMHAHDFLSDVLGDNAMGRAGVLHQAMQMVDAAGSGVIVLLREPRPSAVSDAARSRAGEPSAQPALRDYGIGAQILLDLGVKDMQLITTQPKMIVGLEGYGLHIAGHIPPKAAS
jgi:3,4-dihydroxy 2-butanone 4-phosphate synthase/GTP cyclohydrolase II